MLEISPEKIEYLFLGFQLIYHRLTSFKFLYSAAGYLKAAFRHLIIIAVLLQQALSVKLYTDFC